MRKDNLLVLQTRKASQLNAANMPRIVAQPSVAIKQKVPSEVAPEVVVSVEPEEVVSHCSSSVQIFMPRERVQLLDEFTYQHASTRPASGGGSSRCSWYGGISLGSGDDKMDLAAAIAHVNFCPGIKPCYQQYTTSSGQTVSSVTTASVVIEQPSCDRGHPARYLCDAESIAIEQNHTAGACAMPVLCPGPTETQPLTPLVSAQDGY